MNRKLVEKTCNSCGLPINSSKPFTFWWHLAHGCLISSVSIKEMRKEGVVYMRRLDSCKVSIEQLNGVKWLVIRRRK